MKNGYLVKIVPPVGYRVFRLEFARRHIVFALVLVAVVTSSIGAYYVWTIDHAQSRVDELRLLTDDQRDRLQKIDAQAAELDEELRGLQLQNEQIRKMIGAKGPKAGVAAPSAAAAGEKDDRQSMRDDSFARVAARIARLRADSLLVRTDGDRLRGVALRVMNMHRLEDLARARVLAAIPSVNPAGRRGGAFARPTAGGSIHGPNSTRAWTSTPTTATPCGRPPPEPSSPPDTMADTVIRSTSTTATATTPGIVTSSGSTWCPAST